MMSSGTSTDTSTFRPWHFFALAALVAATTGVLLARDSSPAGLILLSLTIGAGALAGLALYRTLWPLADSDFTEATEMVGERTRAAVEREKTLMLRSIKELEFDRAMGKVSEKDFHEMSGRLRTRAINLMKQLDIQPPTYRDLIERELEARLSESIVSGPREASTEQWARSTEHAPSNVGPGRSTCAECGTSNEPDARFCKICGSVLENF